MNGIDARWRGRGREIRTYDDDLECGRGLARLLSERVDTVVFPTVTYALGAIAADRPDGLIVDLRDEYGREVGFQVIEFAQKKQWSGLRSRWCSRWT